MDDSSSSDLIGEFTCITAKLLEARDQVVSGSISHCKILFVHFLLFLSFQVHCTDYDSDGSHDLIGSFETNLSQLQKAGASSPVSFSFFYLLKWLWRVPNMVPLGIIVPADALLCICQVFLEHGWSQVGLLPKAGFDWPCR